MAIYTELYSLISNDGLRNKVRVATVIAAQTLLSGTPTADETDWAASVLQNVKGESDKAFISVLAVNKGATQAAIAAATDAAIQTNVDAIVPSLVVAFAASLARQTPSP